MQKTGDEVSLLGFGCMRFKGKFGKTDMKLAEKLVAEALSSGVNYFDTAYMYPGNEKVVGTLLAKEDELGKRRDRVFIATKLPAMLVRSADDFEKMLATSLERLGTDYIDYYLVHSISSFEKWAQLREMGLVEFLEKARDDGRIKHIGFSYHGNLLDFRKMVDDYDWEFTQIQYNYLDENFQAGTEGLLYAAERGLGIVVMEPLRGGMLIDKMPPAAKRLISEYKDSDGISRKPADWGLRWVFNHPEVHCVLSGMNEMHHVKENVKVASDSSECSLTAEDLSMIEDVKAVFDKDIKIQCTACSYCMPCPFGVNIPLCFSIYNTYSMFGGFSTKFMYSFNLRGAKGKTAKASACTKCGACEKKCPQDLPIMKTLDDVTKTLDSKLITGALRLAKPFLGK
jgi:predicted aldo/keto reductase-like oxidoreductase